MNKEQKKWVLQQTVEIVKESSRGGDHQPELKLKKVYEALKEILEDSLESDKGSHSWLYHLVRVGGFGFSFACDQAL